MFYEKLERKLEREVVFLEKECGDMGNIRKIQAVLKFPYFYLICWEFRGYMNDLKKSMKRRIIRIKNIREI